ncbi:7429_t:CDS:2, partial [Gigaspora rosea]
EGNFVVGREGSVSKKCKKNQWFCWRNNENKPIPLSDHYSGNNISDFVPIARPSTIPPKTHITRNRFNKKRVRSDVVEPLSKEFAQPTAFNFNEINKGKQKAVEIILAPDTQPADFNLNKINKGKQKAVEMTLASDTQPTDFGMNPPPSEMNPGPDTQPTDFNFNKINKAKQKAVEMTLAPNSQPTDFNFNKINKGKQKAVEMTLAPDTQPTDFGMNPSPSDIGNLLSYRDKNPSFVSDTLGEETEILSLSSDEDLNPDDPVNSEILEILSNSEEVLKKFFESE